jgi:UDP-glucuronate 4-epimerase
MKILITGTAGFIGFHLVEKLSAMGHIIIGVDSINDYYDIDLKWNRLDKAGIDKETVLDKGAAVSSKHKDYTFYRCNLAKKEELFSIFEKTNPEAVCNLAAQAGVRYSLENPSAYIESNIIGFQNILDACREYKITNLSYASSSSVYGGNQNLPFSEKDRVDHPISLYAATKRSNELVAHTYSHLFGIQTTGLRFFTVYGPWGRPDMALYLFCDAMMKGKSINVFNHGDMLRDFTYVDDIVTAVSKIIENPVTAPSKKSATNPTAAPYKIYNIGNNNPVKLMDFVHAIEDSFKQKFKVNFMELQKGDVPSTYADVDSLMQNYNYKPNTSIQKGIGLFVDWFKDYHKIT